jgi:hypothetical protein
LFFDDNIECVILKFAKNRRHASSREQRFARRCGGDTFDTVTNGDFLVGTNEFNAGGPQMHIHIAQDIFGRTSRNGGCCGLKSR